MKQHDFDVLLSSLDNAVEILARHRTPDGLSVAAFDTLKQARAMVLSLSARERHAASERDEQLAA